MTSVVGQRVRMIGWEKRTSGTDAYAGDLHPEGLCFGRVLRSPHPHAEITRLDVSKAERMPGVRAVITAADFPKGARYIHSGGAFADRAPLAEKVVRYVGEEVAAVAADTWQQAEAALRAIDVRYRRLPAPVTMDEAVRPGASRLHQRPTGEPNVAIHDRGSWGDPERGRRESSVTVDGTYWYPRVAHAVMEQNTTIARWDRDHERFELWTSSQAPHFVVKELAHVFGLEPAQIVCREVAVGGGFGSKSKVSEHEALAAALARKGGRPVKIVLTRDEEFADTKPRHAFRVALKASADGDSRLRLIEAKIDVDNGAYNHFGPSVMWVGIKALGAIYEPRGLVWDARLIDTALTPGGQFRGYGSPQSVFALECAMDELAAKMGMDPLEFRLRNKNHPNTVTLCGAKLANARLDECLEAVRGAIGWDEKRGAKRRTNRGVGVAAAMHGSGSYAIPGANTSMATIDLFGDGHARVRFGGADAGTGQRTILTQIAAEELGLPYERVEIVTMDSERTPIDQGAWSSRGTHMGGHAVRKAARELAERLRNGERVPAGGVLTHESSYTDTVMEPVGSSKTPNFSASYTFAAHAVEVEVDPDTGEITVLDYVAAHDIGRAINPTLVEGQIIGGVAMGLGAALGEELIYEAGRPVNAAYLHYALPRAADMPRVRPILIEEGDPAGPYGAKSIGELGVVPAAPAIANAVYDAIGVRIRDLPITPDKILSALAEKNGKRPRRHRIWARPDRWEIEIIRRAYPLGLHWVLDRIGTRFAKRRAPRVIGSVAAPRTLSEAFAALDGRGRDGDAAPIGGGTDLLLQRRQGLAAPRSLVSVGEIEELTRLGTGADGAFEIGAGVTLARLARDVASRLPVIAEAVGSIASPQVRAVATVGGNLVQEKRCWFFRNGFECYKRGGVTCPCYAVQGDHRFYHAAMEAHRCQATTPSDLATALGALDAEIVIGKRSAERVVHISSFYTGPGETVLRDGELVLRVRIPSPATKRRAAFEKLGLWQGDFAVVSAALSAAVDDAGLWRDVRVVLGALAPTPWRATRTEDVLEGTIVKPEGLRRVLDDELARVGHPLERNAWKLDAALGLATRAAARLAAHAERHARS